MPIGPGGQGQTGVARITVGGGWEGCFEGLLHNARGLWLGRDLFILQTVTESLQVPEAPGTEAPSFKEPTALKLD